MIICPKCKTENGDDFRFCCECGQRLSENKNDNKEEMMQEVAQDTIAFDTSAQDTVAFDTSAQDTIAFDTSAQDTVAFDASAQDTTTEDTAYETSETAYKRAEMRKSALLKADKKQGAISSFFVEYMDDEPSESDIENGYSGEVAYSTNIFTNEDSPAQNEVRANKDQQESEPKQTQEERKAAIHSDISFIMVAILLLAATIFLGYYYVQKNWDGDFKYMLTNILTDEIVTRAPEVVSDRTGSGEPAIKITVYARKGSIVTFTEGATSIEMTMKGRSLSFRVPISIWTSNVKEGTNALEIKPNVFVRHPDINNEVTKLEFDTFYTTLVANVIDINITTPDKDEISTQNSTVTIEGTVSDPTVALYMNSNQLQVDENGYFRTIYHVEAVGEQEVVFTAQKGGYAIGEKRLKIIYEKSDMKCKITSDAESGLRTFTETLDITGVIDKGAKLKVSGVDIVGDVNVDKDGKFNFTASLPNIGNYLITLTVSAGDSEATFDIYAEHAPDREEYIRSAWQLDYEWLEGHSTMQRALGVSGKIVEVYSTEPFVKAKMHTEQGDIIFTYYHTTEVSTKDGKSYRIYAYPDGKDEETGLPQLYCWFIYKS